jgi:hypothetical protein
VLSVAAGFPLNVSAGLAGTVEKAHLAGNVSAVISPCREAMRMSRVGVIGVSFVTLVAEVVIVEISMLTCGGIGNVLTVGVRLVTLVAEVVIVYVSMLACGGIRDVLAIGVSFVTLVAKAIIVLISMLAYGGIAGCEHRERER